MTKKADPKARKYGNPTPTVLSRNDKGQFVRLPGSLTKKKQYDRKRRIAVAYRFTRQEHSFIKHVAYKIGVSLQAFCASAPKAFPLPSRAIPALSFPAESI